MTNFGAFIDLGNGIEGMIHVGDITREKRLEHPEEVLQTGATVKAQVLEFDRSKRRIRLGMKQLEPTSTDHYIAEHQVGESVTGRVVEVKGDRVKVELGDGVFGTCKLASTEAQEAREPQTASRSMCQRDGDAGGEMEGRRAGRSGQQDSGKERRPGRADPDLQDREHGCAAEANSARIGLNLSP